MKSVLKIFIPFFIMALSPFLYGKKYTYKLYYLQQAGVLYDTKHEQIEKLCVYLSTILDTIDQCYYVKNIFSILEGTDCELKIIVEERCSPTQAPRIKLVSKNKSFLKSARKLTKEYMFGYRKLPPPPEEWIRKYYETLAIRTALTRSIRYEVVQQLPNGRPPSYQEVLVEKQVEDGLLGVAHEVHQVKKDNEVLGLDQIIVELLAPPRTQFGKKRGGSLKTPSCRRPLPKRKRFYSRTSGRFIPIPTRCPTHSESLDIALRQKNLEDYLQRSEQ